MAILESPSACIAAEEGVIAKAVLMPGDPLRAKFVAEHYLENPVCFNTVRNMLGYTGTYKGRKLSVMGHGMGVPSAGLYAHELYNFYGVDTIIRIGSAGGIGEDVKVRDVVLAMGASTNSHFADQYRFPGQLCATADYGLLKDAAAAAERLGKKEILVNNLFTQYSNLISDSNLETAEEVFTINELKEITDFINKAPKRPSGKEEKRMSITINKNGKTFIVECIIFQDMSFEISINDVTMEEEQIRLKRQLTQNIAHELKTPVSSIQGYLETIVNNDHIPHDKINVFLERCYAQSNRLSRLLRDISVLTRMDEAANMIDMEKVDISVLVTNIVNEVSLELEEKQITVVNSLKKDIQIRGNYSLLYSIFRNLMDNAIAYAGTNIQININCFREDENFYYFSFADTGIGVSPEHLNRLFERFYRVDKGRSRKLGGTGLGLAIVKNAVIIHGGSISAKNNQGGGLEFVFTLAKER